MDTNNENEVLQPASETVKEFAALLAAADLDYFIVWRWVGHARHGVIGLRPAGAANVFARAVDREEYSRSNSRWSDSDAKVGTVRTGSPKHRAILALVQRLQTRSTAAN